MRRNTQKSLRFLTNSGKVGVLDDWVFIGCVCGGGGRLEENMESIGK